MSHFFHFDTISLHAGQIVDPVFGARAAPIYQTTSYVFPDTDTAASIFNLERGGHAYSRITNPTVAVLEQRIAAMEGGSAAVCTASGMAATFCAITAILGQGDHIVASSQMYGGNISLMKNTLPRFGITTTFVDPTDNDAFRAAIRDNTRLIYGELIGNPGLDILDLDAVAAIAGEHHIPFMVDATFNTPYLCRCFDYGANITIHSVTKWLGGHGVAIGGAIVDGGNFDWGATDKYPTVSAPYAPFSGINFWEEFGPSAFATRIRAEAMRDFGPSMSPMNAFLLLQGIETLSLRMDRHLSNTREMLEYLSQHEQVTWVNHPDLPSHRSHALAGKYLPKGAGSIISFGVKGGRDAGKALIENLSIASHLANVGDAKTLIIHPATTTHSRIDANALVAAGISEDMIRLSVGLEHVDDLKADFENGFRAAKKASGS
ncbi:MAG: O-acetylhomoserine aminocarboxypropyltransferase [Gammaproteobacteria bacterium]|nr:O-acetylhomoserine aminocarboxypropyltransferase [Gammaproteobacteria bacterium]MDH4314329.1 O-acetylhomoserine aminocarboxypropyltransferase [Gammaproteobacteria bacterium]MDH5502083.1 O-acetylhomoserine aminocarboxypropyltransferase [Gammaproteobacteria bacterium]